MLKRIINITGIRNLNRFQNISICILGTSLLAYGLRGFYVRLIADDFCFAYLNKKHGIIQAQWYIYTHLHGKFTYNFFASILHNQITYLPLLTLVIWLIILYWTFKQFGYLLNLSISKNQLVLMSQLTIFSHLWSVPDIGQSFYWHNGRASYTLPLILFSLYIGLVARYLKKPSYITLFISVIVIFFAGGSSEMFAVFQVVLLLITIFFMLWNLKIRQIHITKKHFILFISSIFAALLSIYIIFLSPGRVIRQSQNPQIPNISIPFALSFGYSLLFISSVIFKIYKYLMATYFTFLIIIYIYRKPQNTNQFSIKKSSSLSILFALTFLVVMICFSVPLYAIFQAPPARSMAIPNFMIIGIAIYLGYVFAIHMMNNKLFKTNYLRILIIIGAIFLIMGPLFTMIQILFHQPQYNTYIRNWDIQEQLIANQKKAGKKNLVLQPLGNTFGLEDIQTNTQHWVNRCMSEYYNVHTIRSE